MTHKIQTLQKYFLPILLILLLSLILYIWKIRTSGWTAFTSYGGIYGNMFKKGNYLIYGTDYTKLYIVNTKDAKDAKTIDLNIGIVMPQSIHGKYVYVISGDTFWKVDIKKKEPVWSFTTDKEHALERSEVKGNRAYLSSLDGSFYVIDIKDGNLVWKFDGGGTGKISDKVIDGQLYYAPDFWLRSGYVYLASRNGTFYSLNIKNGKVIWQHDFGDPLIGNFTLYKNQIYVYTKSGLSISLNRKNGKVLWQQKDRMTICSDVFRHSLINVDESGQIIMRRIKNGEVIWRSEPFGKNVNCPYKFTSDGVFSQLGGRVFRIDMQTGKTKWIKDGLGSIVLPVNSFGSIFKTYIFGNLDGKLISLDADGKVIWTFDAQGPLYSYPMLWNKNLYVSTSSGMIYKIDVHTGVAPVPFPFFTFSTGISSDMIGNGQIYEITLNSKSYFQNPWSEGLLYGIFTTETGREIKVDSFYYDKNSWKIRFNPPEKGKWTYKLFWNDHGFVYIKKGYFDAQTDTRNTYLKIDKTNSKRLTLDGKIIFNGVGINEMMLDDNSNGSPLDDWATGSSESFVATGSSGLIHFRSDSVIGLDDYIKTYGPAGAGFNIFRFSIMNGNDPLYRDFGNPTTYSIHDSKIADDLLLNLRRNGFHIWLTFFNFDIPYKNSLTPPERKILSSYIKYIIARYGAYTDIWELVNEYEAPPAVKDFLIKEIKKYDFENRPITISTPNAAEDPKYPGVDMISPHWYETENLWESDIKTANFIDRYKDYPKPVVFGEQGNATSNWDPTSAVRMRVRLWTAFFKQGILMFWNDSTKKGIPQSPPFYANIYLGEEERTYVRNLQTFLTDFPLNTTPVVYSLNGGAIRGYGLTMNGKNYAGYFFSPISSGNKEFKLNLNIPLNNLIEWYDPATGKEIRLDDCDNGNCSIDSPLFVTDIAFKIRAK